MLATDARLRRYCHAWAGRHEGWDREDVAAQGILGVLEGERDGPLPVPHAINLARRAMARRVLAGARDRTRAARHAGARGGSAPPADPRLPDVAPILATLDERQRSMVWLGIGLGWSWSSVGAAWGCSPGAAKMTAYRALARLRERFDP